MIEGFRVLFYRVAAGIMIILGCKPIANYFVSYAESLDPNMYCGNSLGLIILGLNNITWIVLISIGAAVFHIYYRTVQKRKYETQYQDMGGYELGYR